MPKKKKLAIEVHTKHGNLMRVRTIEPEQPNEPSEPKRWVVNTGAPPPAQGIMPRPVVIPVEQPAEECPDCANAPDVGPGGERFRCDTCGRIHGLPYI